MSLVALTIDKILCEVMPVLEGGIAKKRGERARKMRMRLYTTSKESYSLLTKKR